MIEPATDADLEIWPDRQAWDLKTYDERIARLIARVKAEVARAERAETRVRLLEAKAKREEVKKWWWER